MTVLGRQPEVDVSEFRERVSTSASELRRRHRRLNVATCGDSEAQVRWGSNQLPVERGNMGTVRGPVRYHYENSYSSTGVY